MPQKKKAILVYEEQQYPDEQREPTKFYGYRDRYKSKDERSEVPNYALLIYDVSKPKNKQTRFNVSLFSNIQKKKKGFRLVPVESHVRFEKVKAEKKQETEVPARP